MRTGSANPLMVRILFCPENHLDSTKVLTMERLPLSAVLDTVTLVHTQILVDLIRFQTVDGVHFSYCHPRIVFRELAVDKVCNSTFVQIKLHLDVIREGMHCATTLSADQDFCHTASDHPCKVDD